MQRSTYRHQRRHPRALLETRAPLELGYTVLTLPLLRRAPRGDGGPVLVLPGLAASDLSTAALRSYLRGQGHFVHGWRLERNEGPTERVITGMATRVAELLDRHERPISLVGWSLGGVYAASLAAVIPGAVRRVVTLGSPLAMLSDPRTRSGGLRSAIVEAVGERPGAEVPLTSIWSRTDAVVPWRASRIDPGPLRENIEVIASHLGIGVNAAALYAVADRLALGDGRLTSFDPPFSLRAGFRSSADAA